MRNLISSIAQALNGSRKAIVAFLVTALIAYIARKGYNLDASTQEILRTLLDGVIAGVLVWLTANK
jgi:uncharacterized membrane protein (DUF441 family)